MSLYLPPDYQSHSHKHWRMNHLYKIQDANANVVPFRFNRMQEDLFPKLWYKNILPKARQLGCTTFIQLYMLDECIFHSNIRAGVIAQNLEASKEFFTLKIKFAYDNLPAEIRQQVPIKSSNLQTLELANGSHIHVDTSHRSGTLQYLHVSEYGFMCAKDPKRAEEVKRGALNTLSPYSMAFIESTAMGRTGDFYKYCSDARVKSIRKVVETPMDYRLHFYGWFWDERYTLDYPVEMTAELIEYFEKLQDEHKIKLTQGQKNWYAKKLEEQGVDMKQEFPATMDEAFEKMIKGAIFGKEILRMRNESRIENLPFERGYPVNTFWDLGRNDATAIWFHQRIGPWDHFIHYYENQGHDISHYIQKLQEIQQKRGFVYGTHYLPHDGKRVDLTAIAGSVEDHLRRAHLSVRVVPRSLDLVKSINDARNTFSRSRIDKTHCSIGITMLEEYVWSWDETNQVYKKTPLHNHASNGADAFRTFSAGFSGMDAHTILSKYMRQTPEAMNPFLARDPFADNLEEQSSAVNPLTNPDTSHIV